MHLHYAMSPTLNESTALRRFECDNVVEIHNRIMFNFYLGLPQLYHWVTVGTIGNYNMLVCNLLAAVVTVGLQRHVLHYTTARYACVSVSFCLCLGEFDVSDQLWHIKQPSPHIITEFKYCSEHLTS